MSYLRQLKSVPLVSLVVLCVCIFAVGLGNIGRPVHAQSVRAQPLIGVADLAGPWQATLLWSNSGCGPQTGLLNMNLDSTGTDASATLVGHSDPAPPDCGDQVTTQTFSIQTLNPDGSGTAGLTCGPACGWQFRIQVNLDATIFNMVVVEHPNPGNFVEGTAIHQRQ